MSSAYYQNNKDYILKKHKEWKTANKDRVKVLSKEYYLKNKDKIANKARAYYLKNRDKILAKSHSYKENRKKLDPGFKLKLLLRIRLYKAIKGNYKTGSAVKLLGCTVQELKNYLESKFSVGMNWNNHGLWHIDHVKPLASFDLTNLDEMKLACHYTNLQPLWAKDNQEKWKHE